MSLWMILCILSPGSTQFDVLLRESMLISKLKPLLTLSIDVFHKWRLWHGNETRVLFSRSILVSNYQTDMFLCFNFAKIAK